VTVGSHLNNESKVPV